jgi:hypothetical protein
MAWNVLNDKVRERLFRVNAEKEEYLANAFLSKVSAQQRLSAFLPFVLTIDSEEEPNISSDKEGASLVARQRGSAVY